MNGTAKAPVGIQLGVHSGEAVSGLVGRLGMDFQVAGGVLLVARSLAKSAEPGTLQVWET